jgi:hypothetical protein
MRYAARQLLIRAGEDTSACRELADRLDGKVPQGVVGDNDAPPIQIEHTNTQIAQAIFEVILGARQEEAQKEKATPPALTELTKFGKKLGTAE